MTNQAERVETPYLRLLTLGHLSGAQAADHFRLSVISCPARVSLMLHALKAGL